MDKTDRQLLEAIHDKVDDLTKWQGAVDERCKNRTRAIEGHQRTLYGPDGRSGLTAQSNANSDFITSERAWRLKTVGGVVVAAIVAVAAAVLVLWKG